VTRRMEDRECEDITLNEFCSWLEIDTAGKAPSFVACFGTALCPSRLPQQPAGLPLRYLVVLACMPDRATPPLGA